MALPLPDELPFSEDDLDPVIAVFEELAAARQGWVNLRPRLEDGAEAPPRSGLAQLFSARGDAVPLATWKAAEAEGQRATIGIEHGSGPKAIARLAEHELPLRPGWSKRADHPRRGLVVEVPTADDAGDVVWWLLAAAHTLSTVALSGEWVAQVYRR